MASLTNGVFLLCMCQLLAATRAINTTFFPCDYNLSEVDCSQRNLTSVPSILHSSSVLSLKLDRNNIRKVVSHAFAGVPYLQNLTMSWNCPPGRLRAPDMPHCDMQIDQYAFAGLMNLSRLFLAGNSLHNVPALPSSLKVLSLEYNSLFRFTSSLGTKYLEQLLLSRNCYYANPCNETFTIHESVFQDLPCLWNLTLGFNNITKVPRGLPPSLKSLDLKENKISEIDDLAFANLSSLMYLNLEWNCQRCDHAAQPCFPCLNNASIKLHPKAFWHQENITNLSLRGNSLRALPDGLFLNLSRLSSLDLSDNLLAYVIRNGTFFKDLKSVTTLNLIYNYEPLKTFKSLSLSPHFSEMTSLKNLLLSGYFFHELTSNGIKPLMSLTNLEKLDFGMNFINSCPIDIFSGMKALKQVVLSQNMLDFIHLNFCQPDSPNQQMDDHIAIVPEIINTERNQLRSDDGDFLNPEMWTFYETYCNGMLFFDLSQNKILSLTESVFKGMEGVFCLDLSYNYLSQSLDGKQFVDLRNLTYLNMAYNRIDMYYNTAFNELNNTLKVLDLSNNGFHFFMKGMGHRFDFIKNLMSLEVLSLAENNIGIRVSTQLRSSSLKYLFFAGNQLDIMWDNKDDQYIFFFKELINLTYLDISRNKLKFFPSGSLRNLPKNLRTLKVNNNKLKYFPWANLTDLSNLCCLNLSGNSLTGLPLNVTTFNLSLRTLDLSHNRISQISEGFFQAASSLHSLLLSDNQLKVLGTQSLLSQLSGGCKLKMLTLHNNPFRCNCNTTWLSDFLKASPIWIPQLTTNIKCGFPESLQGTLMLSMDPRSCQEIFGGIWFLCTFLLTVVFTVVPLLKKLYGWDLWYCIQVLWAGHKGYSVLQGNSSQHDAFVVFDTGNVAVRDWVYNELTVNLEDRGIRRFTLCLEERDWVPGFACIENLHNAVYNSRKTVFVLTNNGSVSGVLKQAFYLVQQRLLDEKEDVIVLVLLDEVFPKLRYLQMRKRLCRKSVLSWPRNPHAHQHFWNKMRAVLATDNFSSYDMNVTEGFLSNHLI